MDPKIEQPKSIEREPNQDYNLVSDFLEKYNGSKNVSLEDFSTIVKVFFDENDLFYKHRQNFIKLFYKISEGAFDGGEESQKKKDLINPFLEIYRKGTFNQKEKFLEIITTINNQAMYLNRPDCRYFFNDFIKKELQEEEKEDGNYYNNLHLKHLLSEGDKITKEQITKNIYAFVYEGIVYFSLPQDKGRVSSLFTKLEELEFEIKQNSSNLFEKMNSVVSKGEDFDSSKPENSFLIDGANSLHNEYKKIQEELLQILNKSKDNNQHLLNNKDFEFFDYFVFLLESTRNDFKNKAGFDLKEVGISEQVYFFNYAKEFKNKEINKIFDFCKKFDSQGFRTFLSLAHGGKEMGDKILALGEKLPEDSAKILFNTYSDMVDASNEVENLLKENLGDRVNQEIINETKESLLLGGKKLLEKYANKANSCEGDGCIKVAEDLKERLALAKKSVFAFAYACKTLVEKDNFSFEDFKKARLIYEKSPLAEDIRNQIIAMHQVNTEFYPDKLKAYWRGTLKDGLEKENEKQLIVYVSFGDDVVAVMRVIEQEDGSWYGASFNVNPTIQGSRVGTELLKKVIQELAKDKPFIADVYSRNPMLQNYIDDFGFEITGKKENYHNTDAKVFQITLSPKGE